MLHCMGCFLERGCLIFMERGLPGVSIFAHHILFLFLGGLVLDASCILSGVLWKIAIHQFTEIDTST